MSTAPPAYFAATPHDAVVHDWSNAMESTQTSAVAVGAVRATRLFDAYKRWTPAFEAIPKEEVYTSLNVDIASAVTLVTGAIKEILPLKEQAARELPLADLSVFDNVESIALAMGYAAARHQASSLPVLALQELSSKVVSCHELLRGECELGVKRGLLPAQPITQLRGIVGYKSQAADVMTMVALVRENWSRLQGRTGLSLAEVDEAEMYADQLLTAIGEREQLPTTTAATLDARQRAYTLFMRTYDAVRRIVTYLRWDEGDADSIAPSVYAGRKRSKESEATPEAPAAAPAQVTPGVPTTSSGHAAKDVPAGMPGASPYTA
jgi:hypothetical protein